MKRNFFIMAFLWSVIFIINISVFAQDRQTVLANYFNCSLNGVPYSRELLLDENQTITLPKYKVTLIQSLYDKSIAQCYCAFKVESVDGKAIINNMVDKIGRNLNGECFGDNNRYTFDLSTNIYSGYSIEISAINEKDSLVVFVKIIGLGFNDSNNDESLKIALIDNYSDIDNNIVKEFEISERTKSIEISVDDASKMIVSPLGVVVEGDKNYHIEIYMQDGSIVNDSIRMVGEYDDGNNKETSYIFEEIVDVEKINKIVVNGKCVLNNE